MSPDKTSALVTQYPKIFRYITNPGNDTHAPISLFIFEIGDGWYDIVNALCANMQSYIDNSRRTRFYALRYNRALKKAINGDRDALIKYYRNPMDTDFIDKEIAEKKFREVPVKVNQVVAAQVKEKFGGLRFYVDNGCEAIDGMIRMAESWAARTCEVCGERGEQRGGGWITTRCDDHAPKN